MRNKVTALFAIMILVQFGVLYWIDDESKQARTNLVTSQREGCARGKLDRRDNAAFQRAHQKYITKVTKAVSVKEDVKRAAREAIKVYIRTSAGLTARSKINCTEVFKNP